MTKCYRLVGPMLAVLLTISAFWVASALANGGYTRDEMAAMEMQGLEIERPAGERAPLSPGDTPIVLDSLPDTNVLLIPESTGDNIGIYDPNDGTFLGIFVPGHGGFNIPFCAAQGPDGNIYVSDQNADAVFVFDKYANYLYTYADAGDNLDNVRGIAFRADHLFVTTGARGIIEFSGPHTVVGTFTAIANSFDICFTDDGRAIVADLGANLVSLHDVDGTMISTLFTISFPEQVQLDVLDDTTYLNASFTAGQVNEFDLSGVIYQATPFASGRGVHRLGNGNLLVTSGAGVFEVAPGGGIIEQQNTGAARYIELYDASITSGPVDINLWPGSIIDTVLAGNVGTSFLYVANVGESLLLYGLHSNQTWLTVAPDTGSVFPSRVDTANVLFYATTLTPGTYFAQISVVSNDSDEPALIVACTLVVASQVGIGEGGAGLPAAFELFQNYPNPFNPVTQIAFALPTPSRVDLAVYDLLGRRVRTLAEGKLDAGLYSLSWDGKDDNGGPAASGVYFYRLTTGQFDQSRKMILER